jgi:hypothetical protein
MQNRIDQEHRGGFSIRTRHARQGNLLIGRAIKAPRRKRQGLSPMLDFDPVRAKLGRRSRFAHHRKSAFLDCLPRKIAAIGARSGECKKQKARLDTA